MLANRSLQNFLIISSASNEGQQLLLCSSSSSSTTKVAVHKPPFLKWTLLVLILALSLSQLYFFVSHAHTIRLTPPDSVALDANPGTTSISINQIAPASAFDKVQASKSNQLTDIEDTLIDTHLNLKLVGVTGSNDVNSARAIISIDEQQAVYFIGSQLISNEKVTLFNIMADHVILNNNGHYERLRLYDSKIQNVLKESDEPLEASKDTQSFYSGPPNGYDETLTHKPNESEEEIALLEINRNLTDIVAMTAHRIEGSRQLVGYKINPSSDVNKFKAAGLQAEDMITAINGIPLTKPDEILASYKSMGSNPITLELERGENVITLEINQPI